MSPMKKNSNRSGFSRRDFMKSAAATAAVGAMARPGRAQESDDDIKFLFVIAANGGGSVIDSFLPVLDSDSANGDTLVAYPNYLINQPSGSNLRCVHSPVPIPGVTDGYQKTFLEQHAADTALMTMTGTSVNHLVASKRAMNGAGANKGRTITEEVAMRHGANLLLPNCNMGESGYLEEGEDSSVPSWARGEVIADARLFPVATDGIRGVPRAPARPLVERARQVRERLDDSATFTQTFRQSSTLARYIARRRGLVPAMEAANLIEKLMMYPETANVPLGEYDLATSPEGARLLERFPDLLSDPFEAKAALAFLLARYRVSTAITFSPSFTPILEGGNFVNAPLGFDFSHTSHVLAQYAMWNRMFKAADGLIRLLKEQDFDDNDPSKGKMWDRSLVYFATEFGRSKVRPSGDLTGFGSGHHLNNGAIMVSPLLNGNSVFGGVDPDTCLTYGFDRQTGEPDTGATMREQDVYSVIASAMDVEPYDGQTDVSCMIRQS